MRDWNELQQKGSVRREKPTKIEMFFKLQGAHHTFEQAQLAGMAPDSRFDKLYDAAYMWAEVVIYAEGWRTRGEGHHEAVFTGLMHFLKPEIVEIAEYLDECRGKRNRIHYVWRPDLVDPEDATDLEMVVKDLQIRVLSWLNDKHPHLMPD